MTERKNRKQTSRAIEQLMVELDLHAVLLDIGASGEPPGIWNKIASHATYIGFDPDLREIHEISDGRFEKAVIVNEAVTCDRDRDEVTFYLTKSPYCSSTLLPDADSLSDYSFADFFTVEREVKVRATTLDSVLQRLGVSQIDWFKTDSQGTDLRLFNSLQNEVRTRVLAVDLEPGLIDAYIGEDLFVDVHRDLMRSGFWLSDLNVFGAARINEASFGELTSRSAKMMRENMDFIRTSPGWVEARYLRTLDWLAAHGFNRREYALLWIFALLDQQPGFALDLGIEYERVFGADAVSRTMKAEPLRQIESRPLRSAASKSGLARAARRLKRSLSSR